MKKKFEINYSKKQLWKESKKKKKKEVQAEAEFSLLFCNSS